MPDSAFFKWLITTCLLVLFSAAVFNYIIDPYNIFQPVKLAGINTSKPATSNRTGFSKSYMSENFKAKTLVLGTSKFDIGIDPESEILPPNIRPAFNFAVPGASVYQQYRYLQHASANQMPELVIMSLDFELFLGKPDTEDEYPPTTKINTYEKRLNVTYSGNANEDRYLQRMKDISASLLSNTAIVDSFKTIMAGNNTWIRPAGLSSGFARFGTEVNNKGNYSVFRDTLKKHVPTVRGMSIQADSLAFKALDDILKFCAKNNIRLVLIMPPSHAFQYELWDQLNLWDDFEFWKKTVVNKIEAYAEAGDDLVLWDFSRYHSMATEDVPGPSVTSSKMQWYWEPVHFKKPLGDIILREVFSGNNPALGVQLSHKNILQEIELNRQKRAQYRQEKADQIDLFNSIVSDQAIPSSLALSY
jgi:hypothetical protein